MKNRIMELRRKQNELQAEARQIHELGVKEVRVLTADEAKKFDELMAGVDAAQRDIEREERLALYGGNQQAAGQSSIIGMGERDLQQYSLLRAVKAQASGDWRNAGLEREASDAMAKKVGRDPQGFFVPIDWMTSRWSGNQMEQRAVSTSGGSGANLIPTVLGSFIDILRARLVLRAAGAIFLTDLVGNFDLPKRTAGTALSWVAQGAAPGAEASQTFGAVQMRPKTGSAYVDLYRTLLNQSSMDVEMLVRDDLAQSLQIGLDVAGLHGTGSSNQPTGVAATAGIGSVAGGTNGLAPAWSHIVDLETEVAIDNADTGRLAYITNPKVRGKLKKVEKGASGTIGNWVWTEGAQPLNSYMAHVTTSASSTLTKGTSNGVCSAIFFGNWADLAIGMWGGIDVTADIPDNRTGTVRLAGIVDADVGVRRAESFSAMLDVLTT